VSENHYRTDLTERERAFVLDALLQKHNTQLAVDRGEQDDIGRLYRRVKRLEPIGTGGTTEGNG